MLTIEIDGCYVVAKRRKCSDGVNFDYVGTIQDGNYVTGKFHVKDSNHTWSATIRR